MTETHKDKCPICHKDFVPLFLGEKNDYTLEACRACGSAMVRPWMTDEKREQYFGEIEPQITHTPNPDRDIELRKKIIQRVMPNPSGKKFLDICSQNGYTVIAAKQLGMQSYGIDEHEFFVEFARSRYGEELFENTSAKEFAETHAGEYDFIYALEAFSLQTHPDELAAAMAKLLKPGGIIYIEEPDGNHWNLPGKFTVWPVVFPPINFVYLSRKGLIGLLKRHGLAVAKQFWSWYPFSKFIVKHQKKPHAGRGA